MRRASRPKRCSRKLAGLGRARPRRPLRSTREDGPDRIYVASDGKADYVYLRSARQGSAARARPAGGARRSARAAADPEGDELRRRRRLLQRRQVRPPGAPAARAARRRRGPGDGARPRRRIASPAGHRFLSRDGIAVATADAYEETLRAEGKVIAGSPSAARAIVAGARRARPRGATVIMPDALLDEVTGAGRMAGRLRRARSTRRSSTVPQECLILTMQQNQKYFALADDGRQARRARFLSSATSRPPTRARSSQGNERVLRARLADARVLLRPGPQDAARGARAEARERRLSQQARHASATGSTRLARARRRDRRHDRRRPRRSAMRAAQLAKADLVTDMVGEFPELQGLMGRYYAQHDGEPAAVAAAIEQHYWPRFAGDALPEGAGRAGGGARRQARDARRHVRHRRAARPATRIRSACAAHALGVIRILVEKRLRAAARRTSSPPRSTRSTACRPCSDARAELENFIYERLRGYLRDAGLHGEPGRGGALPAARRASTSCRRRLPRCRRSRRCRKPGALAAANKRIVNILRKSGGEAARRRRSRAGSPTAPSTTSISRSRSSSPSSTTDCAAGDFAGALLALATRQAGRRPLLRRRAGDGRRSRRSARTGSRCCAAWRRR